MRILAIDPGSRRIGLALSDEDGRLASPLRTIVRAGKEAAIREVVEAARAAEASEVIVGLPLRTDGREGPEAARARAFGAAVGDALGLSVVFWDERFTTALAHRMLREAGASGRARRAVVDQAAAAVLLQSYLDSKAEEPCDTPATEGDSGDPEADPDAEDGFATGR